MQIDKVRVQNFKSIQDSGWVSLEDDLTALVGENEAGKSNFLEALSYIGKEGEVPREHLCKESVDDRWNVDRSKCEFISVLFSSSVVCNQELNNNISHLLKSKSKKLKIYHDLSHKLNIKNKKLKEVSKIQAKIDPKALQQEGSELEKKGLLNLATGVKNSVRSEKNENKKLTLIKAFFDRAFENMDRNEYARAVNNLETLSEIKIAELILRTSKDGGFGLTKFEKATLPEIKFRKSFQLIEDQCLTSNKTIEPPYERIAKTIKAKKKINGLLEGIPVC